MNWEWYFIGFSFALGVATGAVSIITVVGFMSGILSALTNHEDSEEKKY